MKLSKLIELIENKYPIEKSSPWDNSGLQLGYKNKEIKKIFIAFEITEESMKKAIEMKADLVVTHHPLLFNSIKNITDDNCIGRRVLGLISNDIACYSIHTNYDIISMGKLAINMLGHKDIEVLDEEENYGGIINLENETSIKDLGKKVKNIFNIPKLKIFGGSSKKVKKIAILPGSGKSFIDIAIGKGCDLIITGDIDHHSAIDGYDNGINIMDCGHYGLEHIFMKDIEQFLVNIASDIDIECDKMKFPYEVI